MITSGRSGARIQSKSRDKAQLGIRNICLDMSSLSWNEISWPYYWINVEISTLNCFLRLIIRRLIIFQNPELWTFIQNIFLWPGPGPISWTRFPDRVLDPFPGLGPGPVSRTGSWTRFLDRVLDPFPGPGHGTIFGRKTRKNPNWFSDSYILALFFKLGPIRRSVNPCFPLSKWPIRRSVDSYIPLLKIRFVDPYVLLKKFEPIRRSVDSRIP